MLGFCCQLLRWLLSVSRVELCKIARYALRQLGTSPPARLNSIEIAVDIELQQRRRMIRRPAGRLGSDAVKSQPAQIEFLDKNVNYPKRIVLADPVFQAFRKKRAL